MLAALATPTGRRLTAAALGLTSYAHLRAAPPGAAPVGDVEGALTRKPPRRPVRSEGDEPSGTASWHLSEEAASFVDQSVQPVLWRQVTPRGVRASALRFVNDRHRAGWRAWAACLRFRFAAWEADRTSLVRLLVREATSWNEAARIVDNLLSDAITGPFAIHDIKPADPVSVGAAVASCAGNPDNVVLPAPDPRVVDEAQARLGIEFPPHLLAFLGHSNGISIAGGRFQLFGVGPDAAVDLTSFNSPQGWQSRLPSGWLTDRQVLWVGAQYDH